MSKVESTVVTTTAEQRRRDAKAILEFEDDVHRAALEDNPTEVHVGWKTWCAVFSMAISFGPPIGIAFGSVASVVAQVSQELKGADQLAWVVGAWSLATACSFSLGGPLSDVFGRRNPILIGQGLSIIGFIMGGVAQNIGTLIAAEAFIGFACGLIFVSYAGVPEMLPNKYRSLGLGILDGGVAIPWGIVAPLLGQALYKYASWRWIFWISIIVEAIGMAGTAAFYWPTSRPRADFEKSRWQEVQELDWIGLLLFIGGLCIFLIGVTWGGTEGHAWSSASVIAPIVVGFLTVIIAFMYCFFVAKNPLFPPTLFKQWRGYTVLLVIIFVSGMLYNSLLPLLSQGALYMFTPDGIEIGLMALPYTVMTAIVGCLVPLFAHKIGHMKYQIIVAVVFQSTFIAATAGALYPTRNYWAWIFLPAFGIPMFTWLTILTYSIGSLHVPHSKLGLAMGLLGTFRSAGGAVGNAIFSSIFTDRSNTFLSDELMPVIFTSPTVFGVDGSVNGTEVGSIFGQAIVHNIGIPTGLPFLYPPEFVSALQTAVRTGYAHALYIVFLCTIPFSVIALVCTLFVEDPTKYMTNHVQMSMGRKEFIDGAVTPPDAEAGEVPVTQKETAPSTATKETAEKPNTPDTPAEEK